MTKELYIASPLGFSEAGREFMYEKFLPVIVNEGYGIIDPWKLTPQEEVEKVLALPLNDRKVVKLRKMDNMIGCRNEEGILRAFGLVAVLDGSDVDSGVASEIGFCSALGKPTLGYRNDFRLASENLGASVNIQVEYFIRRNKGALVNSLSKLPKALRKTFGQP